MADARGSRSQFIFWMIALGPVAIFIALLQFASWVGIRDTYFRVTSEVLHDGKPVHINWVVHCRSEQGWGEMSGYVRVHVTPVVIGVKTDDGGMVLMNSPAFCGTDHVTTTFTPLLFWGERAGDFTYFEAYPFKKAYDAPAARIRHVSTVIRPAGWWDYVKWSRTAPKNVVPVKGNPFLADMYGPGVRCGALVTVPIPTSIQERVAAARPADAGKYWRPGFDLLRNIEEAAGFKPVDGEDHNYGLPDGTVSVSDERSRLPTTPFFDAATARQEAHGALTGTTPVIYPIRTRTDADEIYSCKSYTKVKTIAYQPRYVFDVFAYANPPIDGTDLAFIEGNTILHMDDRFGFNIERGDESDE